MNVLVLGAAGGTGREITTRALEQGHHVTAFLRDPAKLPLTHDNLTLCRGDVLRKDSIGAAVAGQDAVVSALGAPPAKSTSLYSEAAHNVIAAMKSEGVSRYVGISASGFHIDENDSVVARYVLKPIISAILRASYLDMARMESIVEASELNWTLVVPPRLTNGPETGLYRACVGKNVRGGALDISRADLARYIVEQLVTPLRGLVFLAR